MVKANRIKELRNRYGIKQVQMCKDLGISQGTLSSWENGRYEPDIDSFVKLAKYFDVSIEYIVGNSDNENADEEIREDKTIIPVLGSVRAGIPINDDTDIIDYEKISDKMSKSGSYFGVVVKGDSMMPLFCEGDVLIIRVQPEVENGETAIVCVNGDEHTVKKVRHMDDGGIMLIASNPIYTPIVYTKEEVESQPVRIIGKVVEMRRKV